MGRRAGTAPAHGLLGILTSRFQWLGAWPSAELLDTPGMQWL